MKKINNFPLPYLFAITILSLLLQFFAQIYYKDIALWISFFPYFSWIQLVLLIITLLLLILLKINTPTLSKKGKTINIPSRISLFVSICFSLISLIVVYRLINFPILFDEQYQLSSLKGILETGTPKLPNGKLYVRGLAYNYISSIIIKITNLQFTEMSGRLLSYIYYLLSIVLIWFNIKNIKNHTIALFSIILFSWSYSMMYLAHFARGYMGLIFYSLLVTFSLYQLIYKPKKHWIGFYWLGLILAPLHHLIGIWVWITLPLLILKAKKIRRTNLIILLISVIPILIILQIIGNNYGSLYYMILNIPQRIVPIPSILMLQYFPTIYPWAFLITMVGLIINTKKYSLFTKQNYFHIIFLTLVILISFYGFDWRPSYIIWIYPFFAISFATSLYSMVLLIINNYNIKPRLFLLIVIITLTAIQANELINTYNISLGSKLSRFKISNAYLTNYPDYKSPSLFVKRNYIPNDVIISVAASPMLYYFYLEDKINYHYHPEIYQYSQIPYINDLNELNDLILEKLNNHQRVWIMTDFLTSKLCDFCKSGNMYQSFLIFQLINQDQIVFVGNDNLSEVYLFANPSELNRKQKS